MFVSSVLLGGGGVVFRLGAGGVDEQLVLVAVVVCISNVGGGPVGGRVG